MKKIRLVAIVFIFLIHKVENIFSQDVHFSQTYMTPLLLNPAQAGAESKMRGIINYRNQWNSVATPYVTGNISFDMQIPHKEKGSKGFSAVGLTVFQDKAGDAEMKTFQGNLTYAYHVFLSENSSLGAGVYGGFAERSIDLSALQWSNQYNGMTFESTLPTGEPFKGSNAFTFFDLGAGIHYAYGKGERYMTANDQIRFNAGIALHHFNQPRNSFYDSGEKLNMKTVGYANANIGIGNSNVSAEPGIVFSQQGKTSELILGSLFHYALKDESKYTGFEHASVISLGLHYRSQDAVIASILFEIANYAIGFSYDINVSDLNNASNGTGGFEISLRFLNPNPFGAQKSTPRI